MKLQGFDSRTHCQRYQYVLEGISALNSSLLIVATALLELATTAYVQAETAQAVHGQPRDQVPDLSASQHDGATASELGPLQFADTNVFPAKRFGSCIWDVMHDVGPCVAKAYAAAAAAGGGIVLLPSGAFGLATPLITNASGVSLLGMGVGDPRESFAPNGFQAVTRLVWIGADGATMFAEEAPLGNSKSLFAADVQGVVFDCNGKSAICAKFAQVSHSRIEIGVSEPRSIGAFLTTTMTTDSPGTQDNDLKIDARSTSTVYAPTGILIDGGQGSNWNVSYNRIWKLFSWYANGDGIVFGNSDNNVVFDMRTYRQPGGSGSAVIFAAPGYISPNGLSTSTATATNPSFGEPSYTTRVMHTGSMVTVQGLSQGARITASTKNEGFATYSPRTLVTTNDVAKGSLHLSFSEASAIAPGMTLRCGAGPDSGIINDDTVVRVANGVVELGYRTLSVVAHGTLCHAGMGVAAAAAVGRYTVVFTSPTRATIISPNSRSVETDVLLDNGILRAKDLTIPFSGVPARGDTFIFAVPKAPSDVSLESVDEANSVPAPYFAPGATGSYVLSNNPFPAIASERAGINLHFASELCGGQTPTAGALATNIGGCSSQGPTGKYSSNVGGVENAAPGQGATTIGGRRNTALGEHSFAAGNESIARAREAFAFGDTTIADGAYSWARGAYTATHGRYGWDGFASGGFSRPGDAQYGTSILRGSATISDSSPVKLRVTADGKPASRANTDNILDGSHYHMNVSASCLDHDSASSPIWASWDPVGADLDRHGASLNYTGAYSSAAAPTRSAGILSKAMLQISADATNYGTAITIELPMWTSQHRINCVAKLTSLQEIQ